MALCTEGLQALDRSRLRLSGPPLSPLRFAINGDAPHRPHADRLPKSCPAA